MTRKILPALLIQKKQRRVWLVTSQNDIKGALQDTHHEPAKEATDELNGSAQHCKESLAQSFATSSACATPRSHFNIQQFLGQFGMLTGCATDTKWTVRTEKQRSNGSTTIGTVRRDRAVEGIRTTSTQTQRFLGLRDALTQSERSDGHLLGTRTGAIKARTVQRLADFFY